MNIRSQKRSPKAPLYDVLRLSVFSGQNYALHHPRQILPKVSFCTRMQIDFFIDFLILYIRICWV